MNAANNNSNQITKQDLDDLKIDKSKPIKIVCTFKQADALGPEQMRRKAMRAFKAAHMLKKNRKWQVVHGELDGYGNLIPQDQTHYPTRKAALESISCWENVTRYRRGDSWIYTGENCDGFKLACEVRKNTFEF
jgi:hypothetical protein